MEVPDKVINMVKNYLIANKREVTEEAILKIFEDGVRSYLTVAGIARKNPAALVGGILGAALGVGIGAMPDVKPPASATSILLPRPVCNHEWSRGRIKKCLKCGEPFSDRG